MRQFRRLRKHALQRRYNQCANEGGKDQQHNQRQAVSYPFHGVSVNLFFSVEDDENHTEGVERGHKRTDQTCHHQIDMTIRHRTREDLILTEEARSDQRQCRQCCAAHQEAEINQRNRFTQTAHLEDVLFVMAGQNDGTGCQEQQRFKERVSHQVENRRIPCLHAKREEHVANLAHGRVSENTFDVGLYQRGKTGQQQRNRPDNTHQMQNFRRHQEQAVGTGDQVDTRGYHRCGVDQRGDRRRARHRVSKPCLQRQLRRFTDRTAQQHQRRPHQHVIAVSKVRWCQFHHFAEVQGAQFVVKNEQCESEEHVTHTGHDERFHCRCAILRIGVIEPDQQIGAQAHAFPAEVHQQQVIGENQNYHAGDEQVGVGEEARVALFTAHIPGGVHVNKETHTRDHREHGQRQAVQHQVKTDVKVAYRHPRPQRLAV